MFGLRSRDEHETDAWRAVLGVLDHESDYDRRLDLLLEEVAALSGLPSGHLYLADETGRHLHLERSRLGAPVFEVDDAASDVAGAETIVAAAPLELPLSEHDELDRVVPTSTGHLFSLPLRTNGTIVGVLRLGPLEDDVLSRTVRDRLDAVRFALAITADQAHREETLRRELSALSARVEVGRKLQSSTLDVDRFLDLLLRLATGATRSEAGFAAVVDHASGRLVIRAMENLPEAFAENIDLDPETGILDWSPASDGGALILRDIEAAMRLGLRSLLAVPLLERGNPLGVLALVGFEESGVFDEHSLDLLDAFARQAELMIANDRLFGAFVDGYLTVVEGLARSVDARRESTQGHHDRVAGAATAIARELALAPNEIRSIEIAALVHDAGMAGVVEAEQGYQPDFEHPSVGAGLVEHLPLDPTVAQAVLTHHEWFDGWGFPQGLKRDEIPLAGRVLAVTEFVVEMAEGDPLRPPWPVDKLLTELEQRRGSQFDPRVSDAAARLLQQHGLGFARE